MVKTDAANLTCWDVPVDSKCGGRIDWGSFFFTGLDFEGTGGILEDWKSSYVILVYKIDKDKCALTLTRRMERLPVKTTGGDKTQRTDGRYTVSYCDFLRIAKEISFHHFGLQVCTGKCGDITHLDNCKEFNSVLCKTWWKVSDVPCQKALPKRFKNWLVQQLAWIHFVFGYSLIRICSSLSLLSGSANKHCSSS